MDGKNNMLTINILNESNNSTLEFSALELKKYLLQMSDAAVNIKITVNSGETAGNRIDLGLYDSFAISPQSLSDKNLDDAVYVKINNLCGIISGPNPRSVLFSVYRFLESCGCKWIRPGKNGDFVPKASLFTLCADINEKAEYRYRGYNTCGSYSVQTYLDKVDWSAKVGVNSIMDEFFLPIGAYSGYYGREHKSIITPEKRSLGEITAYHRAGIAEIKRRGLIYNTVGHGWPGVAIGLTEEETCKKGIDSVPEDKIKYLAEIDGERKVQHGSMAHTNLCYGNPEVRTLMADAVCNYAEGNGHVDILHFWLADGINRHCECELCEDTLPSDFYVMMLNEIDAELTARGLDTKIAFIVYTDCDWAPQKTSFVNQDRFIMLFTNHARNFQTPYVYESDTAEIPPYQRNKNPILSETKSFYAGLKEWRKWFQGDSYIWDFHYTNYHYLDQGQYYGNWIMEEDIKRLRRMGINGSLTCSILRSHYPTGFPIYLFAKMHWNPALKMEDLANEYYQAAFGEDWRECLEYMKALSERFNPYYIVPYTDNLPSNGKSKADIISGLSEVAQIVDSNRALIENNLFAENKTHALSWYYLFIHMDMVIILANSMRAVLAGDKKIATMYWEKLCDYMKINEQRLDSVLDYWWFFFAFRGWYKIENPTEFVFL